MPYIFSLIIQKKILGRDWDKKGMLAIYYCDGVHSTT